ncbi:MAG: sodium:proton antiporter NhaD [Flavobacteriales bacterium]|nr:sodium:proton antiporter NhaD [Flavobacteriales bacterium]
MYTLMVIVFILGYLLIAFEHVIHVDKAASALLTGVLCWTVFVFGASEIISNSKMLETSYLFGEEEQHLIARTQEHVLDRMHYIGHELGHHLSDIAEILFFLLGAMTIVELIDAHEGFSVVTDRIKTVNKVKLLWILCIITFFFSAALDNLTTAIVMAALLKKLISDKKTLWLFAGVVVISANAGGAWSPIGDVTTIMLWIGGQVSAANVVLKLIIPSLVCMLIPLIVLTFTMKGEVTRPEILKSDHGVEPTEGEKRLIFFLGLAALLFVPVFKTVTHLPPFMGILLGLGFLWLVTEILHRKKDDDYKSSLSVVGVLRKIDTPSVLFFLGILIAVGSLQSAGHLEEMAKFLEVQLGDIYVINMIIGLLSSIVDNVPLVAGAMGMYEVGSFQPGVAYPADGQFWEFLAYCAGTGGSCLIIGSAAGVAIMGILKIDFFWYIKKISLLALIGYIAGAFTYIGMYYFGIFEAQPL